MAIRLREDIFKTVQPEPGASSLAHRPPFCSVLVAGCAPPQRK